MWVAPLTHPVKLGYDFVKMHVSTWGLQGNELRWRGKPCRTTGTNGKRVLGLPSGKELTARDGEDSTEVPRAGPMEPKDQEENQDGKNSELHPRHKKARLEEGQQMREAPVRGETPTTDSQHEEIIGNLPRTWPGL